MSLIIPKTNQQIIQGGQSQLACPDAQQHMVLLRFAKPIPKAFAWEFTRVHLTPDLLQGGEEKFFKPGVTQPQNGLCSACGQVLTRVEVWTGKCMNRACARFRRLENLRPKRGVIQVNVPSDCLTVVDGQEVCSTVILVLDRRYKPDVLAAVYRTAGEICDIYGWKLL